MKNGQMERTVNRISSSTIFYSLNFVVADGFYYQSTIKYYLNYCCDWQFFTVNWQ